MGKLKQISGHNCAFAICGVFCSAGRCLVTESSVSRLNIFAEKPAHHKYENRRYLQGYKTIQQ